MQSARKSANLGSIAACCAVLAAVQLCFGILTFVTPAPVGSTPNADATRAVANATPGAASMDVGSPSWSVMGAMGAMLGVAGTAALLRSRTSVRAEVDAEAGIGSTVTSVPLGKGGFVGGNAQPFTVISRCPSSGRVQAQQIQAGLTAMAAGPSTKVAINGFGRIGRNVLRCWLGRKDKPFDIVAINAGSMDPKTTRHLLMHDTVLGNLKNDVVVTDESLTIDGKEIKLLTGRDPATMPWKDMDVEIIIESTGAFNSLEGGSKHLEAGAKKVVLTAPGKNCPTYVVGVNEGDYDAENDVVVSNASCTTNGMASVCKVLDESFGVEYGMMTTTHSYTGDQMILDGRHRDLRRARAGACNIVPTSTGAAKAVAAVLPKFKGKLNGIALRVPTPNVSIVDLVVRMGKSCTAEDVNGAIKAAADGPMKGIIKYEEEPLVSSDFMQTDYSNSVDAALTMVMGEDLVKVVMWYDNEWGYSQRVIDMTQIVCDKL